VTKRLLLTTVLVFAVWSLLDFVIHGVLLQSTYEATANLWRPMEEMNMLLMYAVTLVVALCFVLIYGQLIENKSLVNGLKYGALFGLASGISMGFGSYSSMPIPLTLACSWCFGTFLELVIAGAIVGQFVTGDHTTDSAAA